MRNYNEWYYQEPTTKTELPDWLSAVFPLIGLFDRRNKPEIPSLDDYGVGPKQVKSFFNLRRSISRLGLQRQGAQATRTAVGNLPSSLRTSTIPASISADIQTKVGGQIAEVEGQLAGEELDAMSKVYQMALQKYGLEQRAYETERNYTSDFLELAAFLPLIA